ncbi:MAG: hypothetical protein RBQ94_03205 [Methanimicrococcus sp.]|nr:hypothetical protein [Methanimicrococcus sp.]
MDLHQLEDSAEHAFDVAKHIVTIPNLLLIFILLGLAYLYFFVID